jgi:enoyl-CoA hydratase/carnithine racemase
VPFITSATHGRVLALTFQDPTSRNSFSLRAAEELETIASSLNSKIKAIVFQSSGRVFCSGGNLSDHAAMRDPSEGMRANRRIGEILAHFASLDVPTVGAVGGDCFGGGVELISAFDTIITVPHAVFGLWQRRIGLSFGWGGGERLQARLGLKRLRRLALSTDVLSAREALDVGLVDAIVPEANLHEEALKVALRLSALPHAPVGPLKVWRSNEERRLFEALWWNEEHRAVLSRRRV